MQGGFINVKFYYGQVAKATFETEPNHSTATKKSSTLFLLNFAEGTDSLQAVIETHGLRVFKAPSPRRKESIGIILLMNCL
jgi:hypothetical protein